jgi:hypothetical protein
MNMSDWWNDVVYGFQCDACGKHFSKSVLITINSSFKEVDGKYCVCCSHKIFDLMGYCDECENEYPKSHLFTSIDKSTYCKQCIRSMDDE